MVPEKRFTFDRFFLDPITQKAYASHIAMISRYADWGRRFTNRNGCEPWYPVGDLDFSYQIKTSTGKPWCAHPRPKGAGKVFWRGKEVRQGLFWSAKNRARLRFRSGRERLWYEALETDPAVLHYHAEAVRIPYYFDHKARHYLPDLLIDYADRRPVLVEIKTQADVVAPANQAKFQAARAWCKANDMTFEVWTHLPHACA